MNCETIEFGRMSKPRILRFPTKEYRTYFADNTTQVGVDSAVANPQVGIGIPSVFAAAVCLALTCFLGQIAQAAIILNNGSFETIGVQYNAALGGIHEATGWVNNSGLNIQASSVLAGIEGTNAAGVTGNRFLRLVSDSPDPTNTGFIVQNLGTMVFGEKYTITGDALGGTGAGLSWGATVQLTSQGTLTPSTVYDTQILDGFAANSIGVGALNLSYTATLADNGNPLFLWLRAKPSGSGQATRGGLDNLQLATTQAVPEPAPLVIWTLIGLAGGAFIYWRRSRHSRSTKAHKRRSTLALGDLLIADCGKDNSFRAYEELRI